MNKAVCIGVSVALVLDAAWFIRFAITKIVATFFRSDLKSILDESVVYSICSTQDLDFMWHMNNARYFRELDFARTDNLVRSGIYSTYRSIRSDIYVLQHARWANKLILNRYTILNWYFELILNHYMLHIIPFQHYTISKTNKFFAAVPGANKVDMVGFQILILWAKIWNTTWWIHPSYCILP